MHSHEWIISRLKAHPKGGVLQHALTAQLLREIKRHLIPRHKDSLIVTTEAGKKTHWEEYDNVYLVDEINCLSADKIPAFEIAWIDSPDISWFSDAFKQRCKDPEITVWWHAVTRDLIVAQDVLKSILQRGRYIPLVKLEDCVDKVVEYEITKEEKFLYAVTSLNHDSPIRHDTDEPFLWPELAYSVATEGETSTRSVCQMLIDSSTPKNLASVSATDIAHVNAVAKWCGLDKTLDLKNALFDKYKPAHSLVTAIKKTIDESCNSVFVVAQTLDQQRYLSQKIASLHITHLSSVARGAGLAKGIAIAAGEPSECCYPKTLKRIMKHPKRPKIIVFKPKDYEYAEMVKNYLYSVVGRDHKYRMWCKE
ncbi:unknown [Singapore grouper iridovirus]|uniref:Uncharacterized protein n=1 Tax=Singapore grouper iridovirus TaxID=262968 RepID=Q5YFR1_9VIRU|nr:hypothetical protein ORF004L [Singapore grouper iridovirus]AAS18019.1 unknown [Singapore grouper iridovirus]WAU86713.1 hypothetical protein ORF004L [Singapore grouper iridovirus]